MSTREKVLDALWEGGLLSGEALAQALGVSRSAVSKAVAELRAEGYGIEAAPNRGYRLTERGALTARAVSALVNDPALRVECARRVTSTNTLLKERAERGEAEGLALIAEEQTAGKGRMGRSFFSPPRSGLYLSLLLRPRMEAREAVSLTCAAAAAVAETIEEVCGEEAQIKWVNDVLVRGKKVAGILTEGSLDCETGYFRYAVVGIGVNLTPPPGGFPAELRSIAGGIREAAERDLRPALAAGILERLLRSYRALPEKPFFAAYEKRSLVLGREITILAPAAPPRPATALALNPDFSLRVRLDSGEEENLSTGEVSVRVTG